MLWSGRGGTYNINFQHKGPIAGKEDWSLGRGTGDYQTAGCELSAGNTIAPSERRG